MTIKWGDPIECNGVRPEWLRDDEQRIAFQDHHGDWYGDGTQVLWVARELDIEQPRHIRLPADHPAYVALARGFHPWSGGESAPDDWDGDRAPNILLRNGETRKTVLSWAWRENSPKAAHATDFDVIGYRKRNPDYVRVVPFTRAEWGAMPDYTAWAQSVGLIRPESRAERFTRETGHAVTEAVEAALNWKGE